LKPSQWCPEALIVPIPGGTKMEHLDDNLLAVEVCLSAEDLRHDRHQGRSVVGSARRCDRPLTVSLRAAQKPSWRGPSSGDPRLVRRRHLPQERDRLRAMRDTPSPSTPESFRRTSTTSKE